MWGRTNYLSFLLLRDLKGSLVEKLLAEGFGMRGASMLRFPALLLGLSAYTEEAGIAFATNLFLSERAFINMLLLAG